MDNGDNDINRYCSDVIKDADEFVVYVFDHEEATDYQRMAFDDPEIAGQFKRGANTLTPMQREIIEDLTNPTSFLEKMVEAEQAEKAPSKTKDQQNAELVQSQVVPDLVFGMTPEEFEDKFKKLKKKFKKKRAEFETKAKDALMEAAKIYLGDKHVKAYEKYKLELNKSGLSTIMYQVHTMHQAIDALSARIHASGSMMSTKDIDSFVGLQRIMLDVQKFQFEYMQSIESSMKDLKADLEIAEHGQPAQAGENEGIIFFKGGKDFIKQLQQMKNSMDEFTPSASKNKLLNPKAEVVDIAHEEAAGEGMTVGEEKVLKNPFGGYEGQPKKQKRRREFEGEGEEEDDLDI